MVAGCVAQQSQLRRTNQAFASRLWAPSSVLEPMAAESADAQSLAQTHFYLGQLLFQAACEGLNVVDRQTERSGLGTKSAAELKKLFHESGGGDDVAAEIRERLSQVGWQRKREAGRRNGAQKRPRGGGLRCRSRRPAIKSTLSSSNRLRPDPSIASPKLKQFQADVERLREPCGRISHVLPIARRPQLVDLAVAARRFSSTGTSTNVRQYEKLYPENIDEALLERVLLTLADTTPLRCGYYVQAKN